MVGGCGCDCDCDCVVVLLEVELSVDGESWSRGDKAVARSGSLSFLLTRSIREGRVTSRGRSPSIQYRQQELAKC